MKSKLFTFVFNRPDLLQYQIDSFNQHFKDDFEFNVVYDTRDNKFLSEFTEICDRNNVTLYHHLSKPGKTPSFYHSDSVQWIYDNVICKDSDNFFVMVMDHDIFLIESFSINDLMKNHDLAGCIQTRGSVQYIWQGLFIFRSDALQNEDFNFYPQVVEGHVLDSCGGTYKLIRSPNIRFLPTDVQYPEEYNGINLIDPIASNGGFGIELHLNEKFLHYRNACCWHNDMKVNDSFKTKILHNILDDFIKTNG